MKTNHRPIQPTTPTRLLRSKLPLIFALTLALGIAAITPTASGAALTWDTTIAADATITAGSGTWQNGSGNWNNGTTSVGINWNNSPADSATFGGEDGGPYIITVGGNITNIGLTFANSGYLLSAASARFITNGVNGFSIASGKTATISTNVTVTRTGSYSMTGGGTLIITNTGATVRTITSGNLTVSGNGTAVIVGTGGTLASAGSMLIGATAGETNSLEVAGGTVDLSTVANSNLILQNGSSGASSITLTSGNIVNNLIGGTLRFGPGSANTASGTFNLNGGTLTVGRIFEGNTGHSSTFNFNGGTLKVLAAANASSLVNFMSGIDTANVRDGGAKIDPNGTTSTNGQALVHSNIGGDNATDGGLTINDTAATKGTMLFTNASTYTGPTTIQAGTMALGGAATLGATTAPLTMSGGRLQLGGLSQTVGAVSITAAATSIATITNGNLTGTSYTASHSSGNAIVSANLLGSSVNLTNSGAGILTLSGANTYSGITVISAGTVQIGAGGAAGSLGTGNVENNAALAFNRNDSITVGNLISGAGEVVQNGGGMLSLTNANTYSGNTTVSNGTLNVSTRATGSGAYLVRDGRTLGVTLHASGASLQISSLTLGASSARLAFDVATFGNPTAPVLTNTGALTMNGNVLVDVSGSGFAVAPATNVLFAYTGTRTGSGFFVAGALPTIGGGYSASIVDDTVNQQVQLVINTTPNDLTWTAGTGTWDTSSLNWQTNGGAPNSINFNQADFVRIDDTPAGSGPFTVTVGLDVDPGSLTISNAIKDYVLSGSSAITGTSTLVKDGAGQFTVVNSNSYVNTTIISNGVVQVGNGGTSGALGSGSILNNGRLVFNRSDAITVSSAISGSGSLTNLGGGTTTLTGASTYTGDTVVASGTIQLDAGNNRLPTATTVTLGDGASGSSKLILGGSTAISQTLAAVVTSGSGTANAVVGGNAGVSTLALNVGANTTLQPVLGGGGANENNLALTKNTNLKVLILDKANTYDGVTTVAGGAIVVSNNAALGSTAGETVVNTGAGVALAGGVTVSDNFSIAGIGPTAAISGSEILVGSRGAIQSSSGSNVVSGNVTLTSANPRIGCQDYAHLHLTGTITTNGLVSGLIFRNGTDITGSTTTISGTGNDWGDTSIFGGLTRLGVNNGLPMNGRLTVGVTSVGSTTFDLNGYNQTVVNVVNFGTDPGITNSAAGQSILTINNTETNRNYSGYLNGNLAVVKDGAFIQSFGGTNLYTGDTTINGGTLALGSTGSIANSTNLTVASAGTLDVAAVSGGFALGASQTLKGNGTLLGNFTANGTVAPGTSIGTLTNSGATTSSLAGALVAEIDRNGGSPLADKFVMAAGTLTLGGTLTVTNTGATLVNGDIFDLFDGALSGSFGTLNLPHGTGHWTTNDLNIGGTITFTNTAPVAANFTNGVAVGGSNTTEVVGKYASDADGDALTLTIGSAPANGTASVVSGTNITYASTNSAPSDSFTYTVSDGFTTSTGTVTVSTYNSEGFNRLSPPSVIGPGTVVLTFLGIPNEDYALEHTTNLVPPIDWSAVITNTAATNGYLNFTNTSPALQNYYRTRYVP